MGPAKSVTLNMRLGWHTDPQEPNRGKIEMSSKPYKYTANAVKTVPLRVGKATKVADIVSVIVRNRRQLYEFDKTGEGCRHWVETVVRDLETAGNYYRRPNGAEPRPIVRGRFL